MVLLFFIPLLAPCCLANHPPSIPSHPTPSNSANDVPIHVTLSWSCSDPDGDPVLYDLYFGTRFPPKKILSNHQTTTFTPEPLLFNTRYYWMIVATDIHNTITVGPLWWFTTQPNPNQPPCTPYDPHPFDQQDYVNTTPTLSWSCNDPNNDEITYDIYLDAWDQTPDIRISHNQTASTYTITDQPLLFHTRYYWRVIAWDNHGALTVGPVWQFTTQPRQNTPPVPPHSPQPSDAAKNIPITVTLTWNATDPDGDMLTYDLYFGATNPPLKQESNRSVSYYYPGPLQLNTTYFWRVIAWDNQYASSQGPLWSFTTTQNPNRPPNTPSTPTPPDLSTNQNTTLFLRTLVTDPDNDPLRVTFYNAATNSIIGTTTTTSGSLATVSWSGLAPQTTYRWYAIANDTLLSNRSETWTFTTRAVSPPTAHAGGPYRGLVNQSLIFDGRNSHSNIGNNQSLRFDWRFFANDTWRMNLGPQPSFTYSKTGLFSVELRVTDSQGNQATNTTSATITTPFIVIVPTTPKDKQDNVPVSQNITWNVTNPYNTKVTMDVFFGSKTPLPLVSRNITQTYFEPSELQYDTTYYWRVFAYDSQGHVSENLTFSFTTQKRLPGPNGGGGNRPPSRPQVIISDAFQTPDGYVQFNGKPVGFRITATDPDNDNIRYHIEWGDGTSEQSSWVASNTAYIVDHTWLLLGSYTITTYAKDNEQTSDITSVQIKIIAEGVFFQYSMYTGYLVDTDNDGRLDIYIESNTNKISNLLYVEIPQEQLSIYLIDYDFDSVYDVHYYPSGKQKEIRPVEKTSLGNDTAYNLDILGKPWWDLFGSDDVDYVYNVVTGEVLKIESQIVSKEVSDWLQNPFLYIALVGFGIITIELFFVLSLRSIDALSSEKKPKPQKKVNR